MRKIRFNLFCFNPLGEVETTPGDSNNQPTGSLASFDSILKYPVIN